MNLDTSIRDILEAQKLLPHLPPVPVPPHPEAATSGTGSFRPNWTGDADLTPAEQTVKKQRHDRALWDWAGRRVANQGRAEREAAAARAREREEAEWVKLSTREHTKKPKPTNEGVFDRFSKKQRKRDMQNEETLQELHKGTVQRFIKGREQQADIAWDHSQTAKKAWLGNSRKTGIWDPVVPRVVGQIGKIGQHNDALLQTATIFNQRSERAKASADKAKLRLIKQSGKRAATMKNEEYTQVLEQMILTLTGMELEELHEAVGGHLSEDHQKVQGFVKGLYR